MKCLILIILTILSSIQTFAQFSISDNLERLSSIKSVEFLNKNIFVVTSSNIVLFSKDGGKSFKKNEFASNAQILNDSTFLTHALFNMTISTDNGLTKFKKYYLKNNGDTFKQIAATGSNYIFSNGKGFITSYSNIKPKIYLTENYGNSWEEQDSNKYNFSDRSTNLSSSNVKCRFEKSLYTIRSANDFILYQYFNYGDSIIENNISTKGVNTSIIDMAFKDEKNGIMFTMDKSLYMTIDGCQSFTKITNLKDSLKESIEYAKPTKTRAGFYILALKNGGTIYSRDDGKTWYKNLDNNNLFSMNFYDAETGIVTIGRNVDNSTNIFYFIDLVNNVNEQALLNSINIYPNPAINNLNFKGVNGNFNYKIVNLLGQVVLNGSIKNIDNTIDISTLKPSTYLINIETESGSKMYKFIKIAY